MYGKDRNPDRPLDKATNQNPPDQTTAEQPWLFSRTERRAAEQSWIYNVQPTTTLTADALTDWKQRIWRFQQQVIQQPAPQQGSLFDLASEAAPEPDPAVSLDPFTLPQRNIEFWRWTAQDLGSAALYFVIDYELPLLLYVGETLRANQRWKGEHDCKRYLFNYIAAHRPHNLTVQAGIGFWPEAPQARVPRQQLESALIHRWRSPFNKENWGFWGTPFIGQKSP